ATLLPPARIGDFVWIDENQNGLQDPGEEGVPDIKVTVDQIDGPGTPFSDMTTTDADGKYFFDLFNPGSYKLTFSLEETEFSITTQNAGDDALDSDVDPATSMTEIFTVERGDTNLTFDAGLIRDCVQLTDPGQIAGAQEFCGPGHDPEPLVNVVSPSGGEGAIEYLWMRSAEGGPFNPETWETIPNSNTPSYDPGPLDQTYFFIRCVRSEDCDFYIESNIVKITVRDDAEAEIQGPKNVCIDEKVTFTTDSEGEVFWQVGPGASVSNPFAKTVEIRFSEFGDQEVKLSVTRNNCTAMDFFTVRVTNSPVYCGQGFVLNAEAMSQEDVMVSWNMMNDGQKYSYRLDHSEDGEQFQPLAEIDEASYTELGIAYFEMMDTPDKKGRHYYRVEMYDPEGLSAMSDTAQVILYTNSSRMMAYPNPAKDEVLVQIFETGGKAAKLELLDPSGLPVQTHPLEEGVVQKRLDISRLPSGIYYLRLILGNRGIEIIKIAKP
ncbi:MAG: SdrD B-like domain-containing protein, partial [Saprospiraceae bacterium]|nr:SdrD B-like domain-containing protein [Saprospiraceae bacterium]